MITKLIFLFWHNCAYSNFCFNKKNLQIGDVI